MIYDALTNLTNRDILTTEFNNCFIIQSACLFCFITSWANVQLPFSTKDGTKLHTSRALSPPINVYFSVFLNYKLNTARRQSNFYKHGLNYDFYVNVILKRFLFNHLRVVRGA